MPHFRGAMSLWVAALICLLAVSILIGWRWTERYARQAEREFPPLGKFVMVQGLRIHYVERGPTLPASAAQGNLPTIVLLHGAFSALQDFTATIFDELAQSHRVIALDRPGHGYSERDPAWVGSPQAQAALLRSALAALGIDRATVVGFSYGGTVAMAYAQQFPGATAALVLLAGPTHPWPDPIEPEYFISLWPVIGPLIVHTLVAPLGSARSSKGVAGAFYPLPVAPGFSASPFPLALRPASFAANAQDMRLLKDAVREMSPHYPELQPPVTIVHGTLDHVVGIKTHSDKLKAQLPGVRLIPIPGAGHQIMYTHPRIVIDAILEASPTAPH
jgi:pimeloyl-ACP methyl ester carboxylesterase